eukprot:6170073-Prorocentrum_lima.AAC.1
MGVTASACCTTRVPQNAVACPIDSSVPFHASATLGEEMMCTIRTLLPTRHRECSSICAMD